MRLRDHPRWIDQVRAGDFGAIPDPFTWEESCEFTHFIDGYAISEQLGWGSLRRWANEQLRQAEQTGTWSGTAIKLWCCLFYEHRRYRHFGEDPTGSDLDLLNALCATLRQELVRLPANQQARLIHLFQPPESRP